MYKYFIVINPDKEVQEYLYTSQYSNTVRVKHIHTYTCGQSIRAHGFLSTYPHECLYIKRKMS